MPRLLLVLALLAGCRTLGLACTEMGCSGSLTIAIDGGLPEGAGLAVILDDRAEVCGPVAEGAFGCLIEGDGSLRVETFGSEEPEEVLVRVTVDGEVEDHPVDVAWGEPFFPNGKACDGPHGGCRGGEAELAL